MDKNESKMIAHLISSKQGRLPIGRDSCQSLQFYEYVDGFLY